MELLHVRSVKCYIIQKFYQMWKHIYLRFVLPSRCDPNGKIVLIMTQTWARTLCVISLK